MIRSSALLTAVAMAILVAGVAAGNLALIYLSIALSIVGAVTLAVGVLLRRRELFGETGAAPQRDQPGRAAGTARVRPVRVRPAADDRVTAERGARREDTRRVGEQAGDLAARLQKAGSGAAADTGSARWPASIAAKGAPATARRGGEPTAGGGRVTRSPAGRAPAASEPAHGDRAGRERDDRDPAAREAAKREATGREPVPTGSTERGTRWPPRPGSVAAAAAGADRGRTPPGHDREQETPARRGREQGRPAGRGREQAGRQRGEAAAGRQAEAFRLPPQDERTRARAEEPGAAISSGRAGDDFRDRVGEGFVDSGSQDPVRPAWPATAGPRAMGTGSAARRAPGETGDEPEEARPAEPQQPQPIPWAREAISRPPVPPDDEAARAAATAVPAPSSSWSAWSPARTGDQGTGAGAGEAGRDSADRDAAHDERAVMQATAGTAAGTETGAAGAAGETGDQEAEAGAPGDAAVDETADRAGPGGAAPGEAERPGADGSGETAGSTAEPQSEAEPGSTHDDADAGEAAGAEDAGDAGVSGAGGADADGSSPLDEPVTVVPGVPRYHRRGCILIRFLSDSDLETSTRRAAEAAGLVPCKACQPDMPA